MKAVIQNKLVQGLGVLALTLASSTSAHASCSELLKSELENLKHESKLAKNDLLGATIFSSPGIFLFWPAFVVFEGIAIRYKILASSDVSSAEKAIAIYGEAESHGGKYTERLYRKLKRRYPAAQTTYEQMLASIHENDLNEVGCAPGTIPSKRSIIDLVESKN